MKDAKRTTPHARITVVGASGTIGAEVARLAVAYGAEVVGVTRGGRPAVDEPWVHGVTWLAGDFRDDATIEQLGGGALVVAAQVPLPATATERFDRVVVLRGPADAGVATAGVVVARPRRIDATPLDGPDALAGLDDDTIRVETLAMALLRAGLDEGIAAVLEHEDLAYLGDAVMLQG